MDPSLPEDEQQGNRFSRCAASTKSTSNGVACAPRPRAALTSFPRGMLLVVAVAVAILALSLPTAAHGSGPGTGLRSTAPARERRRASGSAAQRKTTASRNSCSSSGGIKRRDGLWSGGFEEHDHDDTPQPEPRPLARTRRGSTRGEKDKEHLGVGGFGRRRTGSGVPRDSEVVVSVSGGAEDMAGDTPGSSSRGSFAAAGDEEEEEEDRSSWAGSYSEDSSGDDYSSSCENYDTEEGECGGGTTEENEGRATGASTMASGRGDSADGDSSEKSSAEEHFSDAYDVYEDEDEDEDGSSARHEQSQEDSPGRGDDDSDDHSVEVCIVTWNLAEESPPARDLEFLREASSGSDLVAVGVQEIENLKPRRNEGGRTREWRRLLIRTLGRGFVRIGHHAMGAVQLTLFARREVEERVKVIKLTEVVCGVGNVLQNKGGIGAFVRVDRTTFLFVAAHLAAHQGKVADRNSDYWRIVTTLDQEVPPAWVTHAARKRAKRARAAGAATATSEIDRSARASDHERQPQHLPVPWLPGVRGALPPRGPFADRVDRVFFFGDLNYRVDLSREDLELGVSGCRRQEAAAAAGAGAGAEKKEGERKVRGTSERFIPGTTYPGTGALDYLLDFDQLTLARSQGAAFGGFAEARVTFNPTYKYDKGSQHFDTSRKMRPPAWTDRILFSPPGPLGVSSTEYTSVPSSCHSDHRPVYAKFRVRLAD